MFDARLETAEVAGNKIIVPRDRPPKEEDQTMAYTPHQPVTGLWGKGLITLQLLNYNYVSGG